jgi:uncharacterized protein (DUF1501 family)
MAEPAPTGSNKLTRRRVTSAAVVGGVTATVMARPTAANAAVTSYTPVAYTKTRLAGSMERHMATSLAAFFTDLGALGAKVTVVTLSEFGRRVKENANSGLDHGHGSVMFLLGAGVKGEAYYGQWPGLTNTSDADLLVTRDYRSVLGEVVASRFGASTAQVFPGVSLEQIGVMA